MVKPEQFDNLYLFYQFAVPLKGKGYQESIISKIFKTIANNHSLSQSQQQTQAKDIQGEKIRISINLPFVESTSEKLWHIVVGEVSLET